MQPSFFVPPSAAGGEEATDTISSLSLRKRRNGFALPKKRKGLVGTLCPNTRKLNCPLNVPAPPAQGFRNLPMPAAHISLRNALRGLDRIAASCVFSHNVRGRHHARRNVAPPGRRHIAPSVQLRTNSATKEERYLWLYEILQPKEVLKPWFQAAFCLLCRWK